MERQSHGMKWRSIFDCAFATALALGAAGAVTGAQAQQAASPAPDRTTRLIELLIQKGVLSRSQAATLMQETDAPAPAHRAAPARAAAAGAASAAATSAAATNVATTPPAGAPGSVHVTYVPPAVREQIVDEVKQQMQQQMAQQAAQQPWAAPDGLPDWTRRFKITGDMRLRGERDMFPSGNDPFLFDFGAINNSANGFDVSPSNTGLPPFMNTTEDRTRFRVRARLNVEAQVNDWMNADIRIASGNDNSPVSTNQTLGTPGDFAKYALWLDRAYVSMHPVDWLTIDAGRAPNPFWTTNLLFDDNVNFDGISAQTQYQFNDRLGFFLNAGAFPVFNTSFNFGTNQGQQFSGRNAYLFAGQGGVDWKITPDYAAKFAVGYFAFSNVQGSESQPCFNPVGFGSCSTDDTKPGFQSFGNTLFPLRNILLDPSNPTGPQPQFFGLASGFDILNLHGSVTLAKYHPIDVVLTGDFVKNLAFNAKSISQHGAVNNLGTAGNFAGSDTGYGITLLVGHQELNERWDWNVSVGYKYVGSDAVLDSLTDSDFHMGGTNAKGYILSGSLALDKNVYMSTTWRSTNQIDGPTYAADSMMVDLNAKF